MDQQSYSLSQGQVIANNQPNQTQKIQQVKINNKKQKKSGMIDDSDSQWSWESIEELKGIDLKKLQAADEQEHPHKNIHSEDHQNNQREKQKSKFKVVYPEKPQNIQNLPIKYVGKAIQKVGDLLIIEADLSETYQVIDLDGWLCDENKNFIGFVMDVFGKIENPFYAVKPDENIINTQLLIEKGIYYIEGTKILNEDEVKSIQSKNRQQYDDIEQSSQSEEQMDGGDKQLSQQIPEIYKQFNRNNNNNNNSENFIQNRRFRKRSFDHTNNNNNNNNNTNQNNRNGERSRTREQHFNQNNQRGRNNHQMRQNNEQYLQNMYAMHYQQMMQFYNPNYQANSGNGNYQQQQMSNQMQTPNNFYPPPPFIMGNQTPNSRPNPFMPQPPHNNQGNMKK